MNYQKIPEEQEEDGACEILEWNLVTWSLLDYQCKRRWITWISISIKAKYTAQVKALPTCWWETCEKWSILRQTSWCQLMGYQWPMRYQWPEHSYKLHWTQHPTITKTGSRINGGSPYGDDRPWPQQFSIKLNKTDSHRSTVLPKSINHNIFSILLGNFRTKVCSADQPWELPCQLSFDNLAESTEGILKLTIWSFPRYSTNKYPSLFSARHREGLEI